MQSERDQQVEALFERALALPPQQRDAFLLQHGGDGEVLHRVRLLLKHDDIAGSAFMRGGGGEVAPAAPSSPLDSSSHPQQIGRYRILSVLGHGGMGTVYEAEQEKPHRKVALKVIRPGWMSPAMLRRFEYEADVLARLDHPGIARIYDAGTADTGHGPQPYFAMELVQGKRLDQCIRDTNPPLKDRLNLLIEICQAVHHAHTKGVIHRDLKPANILITDEGKPKVLDFGVARATDSDIQGTTLHTESGQLVGTLPYMAPEQASGRAHELDTSSDVYALGVIAYELLSGRLPYALADKPLHEAVRDICEDEPSRLSSINKSLRGDVETIVGKALEKDKTRRYHTAGELAADVKRYLDYEPITARRPGTWYQVTRFAKRNKLLVSSVTIIMLVLATGAVTSTILGLRAHRQKIQAQMQQQRADEQAAIAQAVNDFLNQDLLAQASPENQASATTLPNRDLKVREALDRAAARIAGRFEDRPLVEAAIRETIGNTYEELGQFSEAEQHLTRTLQLRRELRGNDDIATLTAEYHLALLYISMGRYPEAETLFKHALEVQRRILGRDHTDAIATASQLAGLYNYQDRYAEAEPLLIEAMEADRRRHGDEHRNTLNTINTLGVFYHQQGQFTKAEPLLLKALAGLRKTLGAQHPDALTALTNLGVLYLQVEDLEKAEPLLVEAVALSRIALGNEHPSTLRAIESLATCYVWQGRQGKADEQERLAKAQVLLEQTLKSARAVMGSDHPDALRLRQRLAMVYIGQNRYDSAKVLLAEALEGQRRTLGNEHQDTLNTMNDLAVIYEQEQDYAQAEAMFLEAWQAKRVARGMNHQSTLTTLYNLCDLYVESKAYVKAEPLILEGAQTARTRFEKDSEIVRGFHRLLGVLYYRQQKYAQAAPIFSLLVQQSSQTDVHTEDKTSYLRFYGMTLYRLARHGQALRPLSDAYERLTTHPPSAARYEIAAALAEVCDHINRPDEAAKWRAELAALQAATQPATLPAR